MSDAYCTKCRAVHETANVQRVTTKNGTPRMVPVHPAIKGCLKFLPFRHGDTWFYDRWTEAVKKAGLELRPHDLRHCLASEIVSRGGTLEDVSAALHHRSLSASRRYAHLYPERVKRVLWGIGGNKNRNK